MHIQRESDKEEIYITWRRVWSTKLIKQNAPAVVAATAAPPWRIRRTVCPIICSPCYDTKNGDSSPTAALGWRKNIESWKMKLSMEGKEVIGYGELLEACERMGFASSLDEAIAFARVLDEPRIVLLFRDKVFLHPYKVVDRIRRSVSPDLTLVDDPMRDEFRIPQKKKLKIDIQAHKHVQRIFWSGLALASCQFGLFFQLTFWEFSWEVISPFAYFYTATCIVLGYAYFLFTGRYPTNTDLFKRLFLSRQRKLFLKHDFDVNRYKELHKQLKTPLQAEASFKNSVPPELELKD